MCKHKLWNEFNNVFPGQKENTMTHRRVSGRICMKTEQSYKLGLWQSHRNVFQFRCHSPSRRSGPLPCDRVQGRLWSERTGNWRVKRGWHVPLNYPRLLKIITPQGSCLLGSLLLVRINESLSEVIWKSSEDSQVKNKINHFCHRHGFQPTSIIYLLWK